MCKRQRPIFPVVLFVVALASGCRSIGLPGPLQVSSDMKALSQANVPIATPMSTPIQLAYRPMHPVPIEMLFREDEFPFLVKGTMRIERVPEGRLRIVTDITEMQVEVSGRIVMLPVSMAAAEVVATTGAVWSIEPSELDISEDNPIPGITEQEWGRLRTQLLEQWGNEPANLGRVRDSDAYELYGDLCWPSLKFPKTPVTTLQAFGPQTVDEVVELSAECYLAYLRGQAARQPAAATRLAKLTSSIDVYHAAILSSLPPITFQTDLAVWGTVIENGHQYVLIAGEGIVTAASGKVSGQVRMWAMIDPVYGVMRFGAWRTRMINEKGTVPSEVYFLADIHPR